MHFDSLYHFVSFFFHNTFFLYILDKTLKNVSGNGIIIEWHSVSVGSKATLEEMR